MVGKIEIHKDSDGIYFRLVAKDGQTILLESRRYQKLCPVEDAIHRLEGTVGKPERWEFLSKPGTPVRILGKGANGSQFVATPEGALRKSASRADLEAFLARCSTALEQAKQVDMRPKKGRFFRP